MLLDSNIIIYAAKAGHQELRRLIARHAPAVSVVSYVEVLGYHRLTDQDRRYLEDFFIAAPLLQISTEILDRTTRLRPRGQVGSPRDRSNLNFRDGVSEISRLGREGIAAEPRSDFRRKYHPF